MDSSLVTSQEELLCGRDRSLEGREALRDLVQDQPCGKAAENVSVGGSFMEQSRRPGGPLTRDRQGESSGTAEKGERDPEMSLRQSPHQSWVRNQCGPVTHTEEPRKPRSVLSSLSPATAASVGHLLCDKLCPEHLTRISSFHSHQDPRRQVVIFITLIMMRKMEAEV